MADDAFLFIADDTRPQLGAPLSAVGELECLETTAVRGWLQAHEVTPASAGVRILPPEAGAAIPDDAERLPLPLSEEETEIVRRSCVPPATAEIESELLDFRHTAEDRTGLVTRALAHGVPAHRIVELTGLDPEVVGEIGRDVTGAA
ncbi:DUF6003 family protein [Streptomyces sp. SYSU K21746]